MATSSSLDGYTIKEYYGIVSGYSALGTGFASELSKEISDFLGSNSGRYTSKIEKAKEIALSQLETRARNIGANAIVGIDVDITTFSADVIGIIANGTAVRAEKKEGSGNAKFDYLINDLYWKAVHKNNPEIIAEIKEKEDLIKKKQAELSAIIPVYSKAQADIEPALKDIRKQIEEKKLLLEKVKLEGKMSKILLIQKEINKLNQQKEEIRKPVDIQRQKIKQLKEEIASTLKEIDSLKRGMQDN